MKCRKKSTDVFDAVQFDGSEEMADEMGLNKYRTSVYDDRGRYFLENVDAYVPVPVNPTDWIITNQEGTRWVVSDAKFKAEYEEA